MHVEMVKRTLYGELVKTVLWQDFVVRNDSTCGSTIGPIMSAKLGMATVDVGAPQLAMHSIREMGDTTSVVHATNLFRVGTTTCFALHFFVN